MPASRVSLRMAMSVSVALLLGLALAAVPVSIDPRSLSLNGKITVAKNGGNGGNGNGGRNGGGNGNGNGAGNSANASKGLANGTDDDSAPGSHGALASSLGALNAAHASPNALEKAAPNSRVGRVATYGKVVGAENTLADPNATAEQKTAAQAFLDSLDLGDLTAEEAERSALEDAANKTVTDRVMDAVNSLLDL